jgi:hypothetical protein
MVAARRLCTSLVAAAAAVTLAAPSFADTVSLPVSVNGLGGTRQFNVEDITGQTLTAFNLGTGGSQPFRVHVTDSSFLAGAGQANYTVSATMSNLYLKNGSSHDYTVKVPSSALSINFGGNPLAAKGLSLIDLPKLTLSGVLSTCASLSPTLKSILGLSVLGVVLDSSNTAVTQLCLALGALGGPVSGVVDGALQNLTPAVSSVLDLPTALSGATGGTFSNPSFGVGTVGEGDPAATATPATSVGLMTGTQNLTSGLVTALTSALTGALSGLPVVAGSGTPAQTTVTSVINGLAASGSSAIDSALANVLSTLSAADQLSLINSVVSLTPLAPVLADIKGVNGQYFSFPVLKATPQTPVPGTYDGTMTVTFVQS